MTAPDDPTSAGLSWLTPGDGGGVDPTLAGRLKALALTAPLHDLDSRKTLQSADWADYQMSELALVTIDLIAAEMDFDTGADPDNVRAGVARHAAIQAPDHDDSDHVKVADWVVQNLLNVGSADRGFTIRYGTRGPGGYVRRDFHFKLLEETLGADGDPYLRATTEAINVLIGALDLDIAAAHTAADLRLDTLIRSGKLTEARSVAREAKLRTIQYGEQLRQQLDAANRDVRNVDWIQAVPDLINRALTHIEERSRFEHAILLNLIDMRDTADDTTRRLRAAELATEIADCLRRQAVLDAALQRAGATFRAEQDRQTFTAASSAVALDLHGQLLLPALELTIGAADEPLTHLFAHVVGPNRDRQAPRLADLFDDLITPAGAADPFGDEQPDPDLTDDLEPERFPEQAYRAMATLLDLDADAPQRLSGLLAAARAKAAEARALADEAAGTAAPDGDGTMDGDPDDTNELDDGRGLDDLPLLMVVRIVARAAQEIETAMRHHEPHVLLAVDDGTVLDDPQFAGADLIVGRADLVAVHATATHPSDRDTEVQPADDPTAAA